MEKTNLIIYGSQYYTSSLDNYSEPDCFSSRSELSCYYYAQVILVLVYHNKHSSWIIVDVKSPPAEKFRGG